MFEIRFDCLFCLLKAVPFRKDIKPNLGIVITIYVSKLLIGEVGI